MFAALNIKILLALAAAGGVGLAGGYTISEAFGGDESQETQSAAGDSTADDGGAGDGTDDDQAVDVGDAASAAGVVFEDVNGNGQQDDGEPGIVGASVRITNDENGALTDVGTGADGTWRFDRSPSIDHSFQVDVSTLPFPGELTTGREVYNLNVPGGYFAPNISFGFQEVEPANVYGTVFDDVNGNGEQEDGESGLAAVTLTATEEDTGELTTVTTDADGNWQFEYLSPPVNHRIRVDVASLPWPAELTTGREEYNLNVPGGYFAPNIDFGFQAVEPANVYGTVFDDVNGNGEQDDGESGIAGVIVVAIEEDTGAPETITTDADGNWQFEYTTPPINHRVLVDTTSLPWPAELTTGREEYNLNVPGGYFAPNIDFGYREVEPARVFGTVFDDANGNGELDEGESGLAGVELAATDNTTGDVSTLITDANGDWTFEDTSPPMDHTIRVDTSTLPWPAQLTTGRDEISLRIPPGFFAPSVNFGYQEVEPAAAYGTVFDDANGNGELDEGESGLAGVTLLATDDDTGEVTTITTDAEGNWGFEDTSPPMDHTISVDTSTLPWPAQLTTGRDEFSLNIPPGFFAPFVNFGYQEVVPAAAAGTVFQDRNANGEQDEGESGIADVTLVATHVETGETSTITTGEDGTWRFEDDTIRHLIAVDVETIPFPAVLTTSRAEYRLNIPAGFTAPNINFGYDVAESSGGGSVTESEPEPSPTDPDGVDPFQDPDEDFEPFPDPAIEDPPQPGLVPKAGPWSATNYEGFLDCGGFSLAIPASVPEIGFLEVLDGGATLIARPVNPGDAPVTVTADPQILGRYTGAFTASEAGTTITINFFLQVVTDEYITGYLTSNFGAEGVTCNVFRSFDLTYTG